MTITNLPLGLLTSMIEFHGDPSIRVCRALNELFYTSCWKILNMDSVRCVLPLEVVCEEKNALKVVKKVYDAVCRQEVVQKREKEKMRGPFFARLSSLALRAQRVADRNLCFFMLFERDLFSRKSEKFVWKTDCEDNAKQLRAYMSSGGILFGALQTVRTSVPAITVLPPEIKHFQFLKQLHLAGWTHIEFLPQEVADLENLELLNLTGCSCLIDLPDLSHLARLRRVFIMGCSTSFSLQVAKKTPKWCQIIEREIFLDDSGCSV